MRKQSIIRNAIELSACAAIVAMGTNAAFATASYARSAASSVALAHPDPQDMGIPVGSVAPPAAVQKLDGSKANLSDYIGKQPVLIEFWATWCPNCKALEPAIREAHTKYGDRMKFVGVAVTVNQSLARVKAYMDQSKLPMEMLWDADGKAVEAYEVPATSFVVIVDRAGKIAYGGVGSDQKLDAAIRKILP
jgi:thiol-disulfide isomerase/thioredoxin